MNSKITPLYDRLSRDDDLQGESNSYSRSKTDVGGICSTKQIPQSHVFYGRWNFGNSFWQTELFAMMEEVEAGHPADRRHEQGTETAGRGTETGRGAWKADMQNLRGNALGRLPDARYAALDAQYDKEQYALSSEIDGLETAISGYEQSWKSAERFIALIDKYENFTPWQTSCSMSL